MPSNRVLRSNSKQNKTSAKNNGKVQKSTANRQPSVPLQQLQRQAVASALASGSNVRPTGNNNGLPLSINYGLPAPPGGLSAIFGYGNHTSNYNYGGNVPNVNVTAASSGTYGVPVAAAAPPTYGNGSFGSFFNSFASYWNSDKAPNDESCSPTPNVNYLIEEVSLLVLLQIKPRIPDNILNSGTFLTWIVESTDEDFDRVTRYFNNSKGSYDKVRIKNILKITRIGDLEPSGLEHGPRKMLFHGTDSKNIGSILNTGFLPANSRYGGGIFFADRVTKSLTYCYDKNYASGAGIFNGTGGNYLSQAGGWVFLCEVFLGRACESHTWSTTLPWGFNSIVRPGQYIPDETENITISDCVWPIGKTVHYLGNYYYNNNRFFLYNEYLVFRPEQARPQYLIEWEKIPS